MQELRAAVRRCKPFQLNRSSQDRVASESQGFSLVVRHLSGCKWPQVISREFPLSGQQPAASSFRSFSVAVVLLQFLVRPAQLPLASLERLPSPSHTDPLRLDRDPSSALPTPTSSFLSLLPLTALTSQRFIPVHKQLNGNLRRLLLVRRVPCRGEGSRSQGCVTRSSRGEGAGGRGGAGGRRIERRKTAGRSSGQG